MNTSLVRGAKSVRLPAGKYIVGDPCYSIRDDQWVRVLDESGLFDDQCFATFKRADGTEGGLVVAFGTAWGDGTYTDQHFRDYAVDAGLIGIIPVADVDVKDGFGTHVIDFPHAFVCSAADGVIEFGHIVINTDDNEDDFDDYEPREDEDY